jgi:hypothetical protein
VLGPEVGDDEINACPLNELTDLPGIREQIRFTQIFSFDLSPLAQPTATRRCVSTLPLRNNFSNQTD